MIVNAHTNVLDVDYDPCTQSIFGDGDDEVWYYHSLYHCCGILSSLFWNFVVSFFLKFGFLWFLTRFAAQMWVFGPFFADRQRK